MRYEKVKGIVLSEVNTEEADKVITLLSNKKGKIKIYAKGAKRTRSRIAASTQCLCYSDFLLFKSKDMYTITNSEVIENFYNIGNDIIKLTYVSHIFELIQDGIHENQNTENILNFLLNVLNIISKMEADFDNLNFITRVFELKFMCLIGFMPDVVECNICRIKEPEDVFFSTSDNGYICKKCSISGDEDYKSISPGTDRALKYVLFTRIDRVFNFKLDKKILYEFCNIVEAYVQCVMEKKYKRLDLLEKMNKLTI